MWNSRDRDVTGTAENAKPPGMRIEPIRVPVASSPCATERAPDQADEFDADWYARHYPDVALTGLPPLEHYRLYGKLLGRPSHGPRGDVSDVVANRPESRLVAQGLSPALAGSQADEGNAIAGGLNIKLDDAPVVRGWLARLGSEMPRVALIVIDDSHELEALCGSYREDLARNGINRGMHAFDVVVPLYLLDGRPHRVVLMDKATKKVVASEAASWRLDRRFSDFSGFLAESLVSPVVHAPFREEDKRCFATMDCLATRLAELAKGVEEDILVSVVMPVHNRAHCVSSAVASVLSQTYRNLEIIVVDDGSTDNTLEVLNRFDDPRIVVVRSPECEGVSKARNRALAAARGSIICYLDSDNAWDDRYTAAMVGAFQHLPDAQALYGGQLLFRGNHAQPFACRFGSYNKSLLANRNYIDLNAFCHKREVIALVGGFDETLRRFVDWDLILRVSERCAMYSVPVLLSWYYFDRASNTLTNADGLMGDIDKVREKRRIRLQADAVGMAVGARRAKAAAVAPFPANRVSIVIPSYESLTDLQSCIAAIAGQKSPLIREVIVVDNASGEPVRRYLRELAEQGAVRLILNEVNYGFTYAVNQGLEVAADSDDVVILNNDAILAPGAIDAMREAAYALPECGMVVPRQILPGGTPTMTHHVPYADPAFECDVNVSFHHGNVLNPPVFHDGDAIELSFAPFCCAYIKREVLTLAPALDAEHGRHYRSDRIYCDYIRHAFRFRIYQAAKASVRHSLQRSAAALRDKADGPDSEYDMICVKNAWTGELGETLGYRTAPWDY